MKITDIELTYLDVPFTPHTNEHMQYWLPHWHIVQICKLTLDNGVVGWGETIPNYTWARVSDDIEEQIVGREAGDLLWEDGLGAGVQIALFDAVGKALNTPAYRLLGTKVREWCPLSWWAMDMPPKDWAQQCVDAAEQRYMSSQAQSTNMVRPTCSHFSHHRRCALAVQTGSGLQRYLGECSQCRRVSQDPRTVRAGRHDRKPDSTGRCRREQTDSSTYQSTGGNALRFPAHLDHAARRRGGWLRYWCRRASSAEAGNRL